MLLRFYAYSTVGCILFENLANENPVLQADWLRVGTAKKLVLMIGCRMTKI